MRVALPKIFETGRLTADPELRFSQSGTAVASLRLAFNSRKFNRETQEWEDGDTLFLDGTMWGDKAEALMEEGLSKGSLVAVSGRLRTESWERDGEKRSKVALLVDDVAVPVRAVKADRGQKQDQWAQNDPPF